jgi:hypothetical protein
MLELLGVVLVATLGTTAVRFDVNPIVTPASSPSIGSNINGPSPVRVPDCARHPLGRYSAGGN